MKEFVTYIFLFLFILVYALVNGYFILSATVRDDKARKIWHKLGVVLRVLPLAYVVYLFWGNWPEIGLISIVYANFTWTIYDEIISLVLYGNLWQGGTTSTMDKIPVKTEWILKGTLFLIFVAYLIIYYTILK